MKRRLSVLSALLILLLCGCTPSQTEPASASDTFFAMDTVMSITAYGDTDAQSVQDARTEIQRLEKLLSRTDADSQVSQINLHAGDGTWVSIDADLAGLLARAQSITELLPGSFDITIAPVMDAWGFTKEEQHVPTQQALDTAMALVDSQLLCVDTDTSSARLEASGMEIDLGAIAKGFAAGQAQQAICAAGTESAMLDLGGNVTVIGSKPDGSAWRVAVKDPQDTSNYLCVLTLEDVTASTSGGYERYFDENGVRYHHIIDPKTGYPADSGLLSVTVVSADPVLADALSTALFIEGTDAALDFWRSRDDFELVLCQSDGTVLVTEGLEQGLQTREDAHGYTYEIARR